MSSPSPTSPKRRPRLSLQIKAISGSSSVRNSRALAATVDVKDHTTFNTLTNVYATAIDRSTPVKEKNDSWNAALSSRPSLRLQTQDSGKEVLRTQTPYLGPYLDTPLSAHPMSPAVAKEVLFPSAVTMTATPPLSATLTDSSAKVFTFEEASTPVDASGAKPPATPRSARRRSTLPNKMLAPPYTHPRTLRSILRNSPLPPVTSRSPISPRRQSLRLQEKAARRVAYNSPLCQTITTTKYTKSHIDLLTDDASPATPNSAEESPGAGSMIDITMAYTGDDTRDGGQTPGPFEEMRRRIAGLRTSSPTTGGIRKKGKKKEKKRRWVWTIGEDAGDEQLQSPEAVKTPVAETPKGVVPLLSLPSPGPKTRSRAAAVAAAAGVSAAPILALPVPRRNRLTASPLSTVVCTAPAPLPAEASGAPRSALAPTVAPVMRPPQPQRRATLEVPALEPPISPVPRLLEELPAASPDADTLVEPPTPSVDSVMSQESIFTAHGDVYMSDASSFMSVDMTSQDEQKIVQDDEMDMDTPTATHNPSIVA